VTVKVVAVLTVIVIAIVIAIVIVIASATDTLSAFFEIAAMNTCQRTS
jgi:hypothetical protein